MKDNEKKEKRKSQIPEYYEDEIDLVYLFKKIWKWKWLIISLTTVVTIATLYSVKSKPNMYTAEAGFKIGQIAGVGIEKSDNLMFYLYETELGKNNECVNSIEISKKPKKVKHKGNLPIVYIRSTHRNPKKAFECTKEAVNFILKNHIKLYKSGIKMMKRNVNSTKTKEILNPKYFLETFNFPSRIVIEPIKPNRANNKKLFFKPFLAFFISFIMSVLISFIFEYIRNIKNENI